jgi:hypothetical protein
VFIAQATPVIPPSILPEWALVLIAGGTIVAAAIAAVNAFVVTLIQTRAQRTRAIDEAHRGYRRELASPYIDMARDLGLMTSELAAVVRRFARESGTKLDSVQPADQTIAALTCPT